MRQTLPFDLGLIERYRVNRRGTERRAEWLVARRPLKKDSQVRAYVDALKCVDATSLEGASTKGRTKRLCDKAMRPVRPDILEALGIEPFTVAAVCVYHSQVPEAVTRLQGSNIPVAAVTFFPDAQSPEDLKLLEVDKTISAGAKEIDMVIHVELALLNNWRELYDMIAAVRTVCGDRAHLKVILKTGDLGRLERVAKATIVALLAGADTVKTSTGKEVVNATLPVGLVMTDVIKLFLQIDPEHPGAFKAAGGIGAARLAQAWMALMHHQLGEAWTRPTLFRIGASSLIGDTEKQLHHEAFGRYPAANYLGMA